VYKIVYVIVSNADDMFYEQAIISMLSVRKYMKNIPIIVLSDDDTYASFVERRKEIFELADEVKRIHIEEKLLNCEKSRWLKTNMRNYVEGDFLYLDVDTVVCDDLEDIDRTKDIACVMDKHYRLSEHPNRVFVEKNAKKCGYRTCYNDIHFNSGVMWVKDTPISYDFFVMWHELWQKGLEEGVAADQTSLNEANCRMNGMISELSGIWNCQISNYTKGVQYLFNCKVIHYFASYGNKGVPYDLADKDIIKSVLNKEDRVSIDSIIENPKSAFKCVYWLGNNKEEAEVLKSYVFRDILYLFNRCRIIFNIWNFCIRCRKKLFDILFVKWNK